MNKRAMYLMLGLSLVLFAIAGCGGGSSSSGGSTAKTAISGAVTFPSISNLVAKRLGKVVNATDVTVDVFTIDGTKVATVTPAYDDTVTVGQRVYSYSFTNLEPGKDYVIKANKSGVALKKLIEKKDVVAGSVAGQSVDAVSTVAVMVASQKVSSATNKIVLGDVPPTGTDISGLSQKISVDVKPSILEGTISAAVNGGKNSLTSSTANYANLFNVVVTAVDQGKDPNAVVAGSVTLAGTVPILSVSGTIVTVTQTTINATNSASIVADSSTAYVAPTTVTASTYTTLAKQYLAAQDISNAALNYEKALVADPNDAEANFGGAITSGMMLIEDVDVKAIITKWGGVLPTVNQVVQGTSPIKLPFGNMTSFNLGGGSSSPAPSVPLMKTAAKSVVSATATQNVLTAFSALKASLPQQKVGFKSLAKELKLVPATAPSISEMQTLINDVIIPKIDKINARLAKAETATFSFTITKAMQGNPLNGKDITLDAGELYTLDAALNIFQILFKIAGSYNFDIPSPYTYDTIGQDPLAMINSPAFFTLKSDGAAKMSSALDNAKSAAAKAKLAYDKVVLRAAGVGAFDLSSMTAQEKTDFQANLGKITDALAGAYTITYNDSTGAKSVKIDVTKFFTNPLTKTKLPTFAYDVLRDATLSATYGEAVAKEQVVPYRYWNGTGYSTSSRTERVKSDIVPSSNILDYTLNGILPDNTAANNIAGFTGILPKLDGQLLTVQGGGNPLPIVYGSPETGVPYGRTGGLNDDIYISYNTLASTTVLANTSVYKLDRTNGVISTYCSSVTGIPTGYQYNGIQYYSKPEGIYARIIQSSTTGGVFEYRPITISNQVCSIGSPAVKTINIPTGKQGWSLEYVGSGLEMILRYVTTTTITSPTYSYTYNLNSAVDNITPILTLTDSTKQVFSTRNGVISVRDNKAGELLQYTIAADGKSSQLTGTFPNIDFTGSNSLWYQAAGNFPASKMLFNYGGYYWLFDGVKMIKYAGKPDGGKL